MNRVVIVLFCFFCFFNNMKGQAPFRFCVLQARHMMENKKCIRNKIILTTCYGNCIAIMTHGNTLLWFKFIFKKILWCADTASLNIGVEPEIVKEKFDNIVHEHINDAQCLSISGGEINHRLLFHDASAFAPLCQIFDTICEFNTYGTSGQVFLKICLTDEISAKAKAEKALKLRKQHQSQMMTSEIEDCSDPARKSDISCDNYNNDNDDDDLFEQVEFQLSSNNEIYIFFCHTWCVCLVDFGCQYVIFLGLFCQIVILDE